MTLRNLLGLTLDAVASDSAQIARLIAAARRNVADAGLVGLSTENRFALSGCANITLCEPLDYPDMVAAMMASTLILTDSGGIQEEAPSLGRPVLIMRDHTERTEGVAAGIAQVVGTDAARIATAAGAILDRPASVDTATVHQNPYGDGNSADAIVRVLRATLAATA